MDLDNAISNSLQPTPIEKANRGVQTGLGQHYNIYATPILNPTPEQQVILQQVKSPVPKPKFHYDETRSLPQKSWALGPYHLEYDGNSYIFSETIEEPFLFFFRRDRMVGIYKVGGNYAANAFMTWMDDSKLSPRVKTYFTNVVAAHNNTHEKARQTKSPLADTFQEVQTSDDIFTGVDPTGLVNADFFGTRYEWGNSLEQLPDL